MQKKISKKILSMIVIGGVALSNVGMVTAHADEKYPTNTVIEADAPNVDKDNVIADDSDAENPNVPEFAIDDEDTDTDKPVIDLKDGMTEIVVPVGTHPNLVSYVTATDAQDGDITNKVKVTTDANFDKVGGYVADYSVTDKDGNTGVLGTFVKVVPNNQKSSEKPKEDKNDTKINDWTSHWANRTIQDFISRGVINGYEDGTFRPDNSITRAEFIKLVNRYFGFNGKGNENFSDVTNGDWFYNDVCIAIEKGYINGYEDGTFRPNNPITREEAAKIISKITNNLDNNYDKINCAKDGYKVSNWAKPYVEGAIKKGYINGYEDGCIRPTNNITRAESAVILSRVAK